MITKSDIYENIVHTTKYLLPFLSQASSQITIVKTSSIQIISDCEIGLINM